MKLKYLFIVALIVMILAQLIIPFKMIWDKEQVIKTGTPYKFRVMPFDPNDPFRGKYINLNFRNSQLHMKTESSFHYGDNVLVEVMNDSLGFAQVKDISIKKPTNSNYFTAKVNSNYFVEVNSYTIDLEFPFTKFYMEETKAADAEKLYWETLRDNSKTIYALVYIKDGDAVLKDVCIDGVSIKDLVKKK